MTSSLLGLDREEVAALVIEAGEPAYRAKQIMDAVYRQRVETLAFVCQPFDRRAARDAVGTSIHPLTERIAGTPILDKARVLGQQIGLSRH